MLRNSLHLIVFLLGLGAALWIGTGYIGHHAVGAAVAFLIAACYCVGGLELLHFHRATRALDAAVADAGSARDDLSSWLKRLPEGLRAAVRLRIEGGRAVLPGPALTPYLVGLLVLLGMLGTLLGMMATLRGTGMALQSATDLAAIRGSLASPVEGLAVAFGTSIAGVAASAMLGLLSALLRRERQIAVHALDQRIGSELQMHGQAWQRNESLRLQQDQSAVLPALVSQLQTLVEGIQQANAHSHAQLEARQEAFIARHEAAQVQLATSLETALQRGVHSGSEAIGSTLQPLLRDALGSIESNALRQQELVGSAVQRQLDGLQQAVAEVSAEARLRADTTLDNQRSANQSLIESLHTAQQALVAQQGDAVTQLLQDVDARQRAQQTELGAAWASQSEHYQASQHAISEQAAQAWQAALSAQQEHARETLSQLQQAHDQLLAHASASDEQRLSRWSQAFSTLAEQAGERWASSAEQAGLRQQQICDTLEATAQRIGEEAGRQSSATLAEITRLLDSAAEAPRAAAEVVGELRQRLSESLVRDTAMLEERAQLLGTLGTLMDAIQSTSTAQRTAVDGLIENAAGLMQRTSTRFSEQVDAQAQTTQAIVNSVSEAAAGTHALASGLEGAVTAFADTSGTLSSHLQQLATALDASLARSDEQLAYYVAQAREVVDLSLLSQKQITEELRQLGATRTSTGVA